MSKGRIGYEHSVFLDPSGQVWTVGNGAEGQLGHGSWSSSLALQRVEGLPPCALVSAGWAFTACLSTDGRVYCFGANSAGQLGRGHKNNLNTPHLVPGLPPIRSLECGYKFVLCVGRDSSLWVFGDNSQGQLGLGHCNDVLSPCRVEDIAVCQVACGSEHSLILATNGKLFGCGNGSSGRLGIPGPLVASSPAAVPLPFRAHSVYCGDDFSVIRAPDGTLWSAGSNGQGQLGLGRDHMYQTLQFEQIPALVSTQVVCGHRQVLVVDDKCRLWGWGRNRNLELGSPPNTGRSSPWKLRDDVQVVLSGLCHTVVRTTSGQVLGCGYNEGGQQAIGSTASPVGWTTSTISPAMIALFSASTSPSHIDWKDYQSRIALTAAEESLLTEIYTNTQRVQQLLDHASSSSLEERVPVAPFSLGSWSDCCHAVEPKVTAFVDSMAHLKAKHAEHQAELRSSKQNLARLQALVRQEQAKVNRLTAEEQAMAAELEPDTERLGVLQALLSQCETYASAENQQHDELQQLLAKQPLRTLDASQMDLVWWRAGLPGHTGMELSQWDLTGDMAAAMRVTSWQSMGLSMLDACRLKFTLSMLERREGLCALRRLRQEDCVVCGSCSQQSTKNLLQERSIPLRENLYEEMAMPYLIYAPLAKTDIRTESNQEYARIMHALDALMVSHLRHLSEIE